MEKFVIKANSFLKQDVEGYYHTLYKSMSNPESQTLHINYLKNDNNQFTLESERLKQATEKLYQNLKGDLAQILREQSLPLYVCVVPRAKPENDYKPSQLLFKETIRTFVKESEYRLNNGVDYIKRTVRTMTTHQNHFPFSGYSELPSPYIGISKDTCSFSPEIREKNILLIDDLYTYSINIDEDMIQALYDNGANKVIFYSRGYLKY